MSSTGEWKVLSLQTEIYNNTVTLTWMQSDINFKRKENLIVFRVFLHFLYFRFVS